MSVFELCDQAIGLLRGKRLVLSTSERALLENLNYSGLADAHVQDEAVICAMHFARVRDRLQQMYPWVFCRNGTIINGVTDTVFPSGLLTMLGVFYKNEPVEYEMSATGLRFGTLNANSVIFGGNANPELEIRYTKQVTDISKWPPIFCDVFVYSLAIEICTAVTGKPEYVQLLEQKVQELIHRAQQIGAIKAETRLTLKEELYNRAIGLSRGTRSVKTTSAGAVEQGVDNAGFVNDRMTAEYQACVRAADSVRDRLLGLYAWRFARKRAELTTTTTKAHGWKYAHVLPDDCVKVLSVHSNTSPVEGSPVDFEDAGNILYSNELIPEIRYTARVTDIADWPGVFADVYCYSLAQEIVLATTGNPETVQLLEAKAQSLIQNAQRLGEIRTDMKVPAGEELYNRAIALVRGLRTVSPSGQAASEQGIDITGDVSYREREAMAVCKRSMPELRDKLLKLYAWKFARCSAQIFPADNYKQAGWEHAYTKNGECMKVLAVFCGDEPVEFEESDGWILCNASGDMSMRYTKSITSLAYLDPVFAEVLCYELAQEISAALAWNTDSVSLLAQKEQQVIQNAYRTGLIQEETRIPLKQEIYNRAIGIARGVRSLKTTADTAVQQGVDNFGIPNDRTNAEIQACKRCSESVRDKLLQVYPWVFARKSADLTVTGTISGWSNGYSLPDDCLHVLTVLADNEPVDFEVVNDCVYCNGANAAIRYTARVTDMNAWSSGFVNVFCYELAEEIISATTGNNEGIAVLEQKKQALVVEAYKMGVIKTETRIPAKLELFNRAIGLVKGLKTEQPDILDTRYEDEISACRRCYDSVRDRLLQSYSWVFCRKTETPAQLSENVPGWRYTYMLPDDCLRVIAVIGKDRRADWGGDFTCRNVSDYSDNVELTDYETAGRELYANRDVVYVRYTARITDSAKWAALFTEVLIILMAIEVALNVVGDKNIIAILEQRLARLIEDAKMNGVIRDDTRLPKQRESIRTGAVNRMYLDYSGIPTFPCETGYPYMMRRPCYEGGTGQLCGWGN